jgi:hypothetical protein
MIYSVWYRKKFSSTFDVPSSLNKDDYKHITDLDATNLEDVFRKMNAVAGTELPLQLKVRSLSVGDVVIEKGGLNAIWYCAPCGWEKVTWTGE